MYHIRNDARTQKSIDKIKNTVITLIETEDFFNMSVTKLCKKANISRSTFYRCFDNSSDVIDYLVDNAFSNFTIECEDGIPKDVIKDIVYFCLDNEELFSMLVSYKRAKNIINHFYKWYDNNKDIFRKPQSDKDVLPYYFSSLIFSVLGTLQLWKNTNRKETRDELVETIYSCSKALSQIKDKNKA